MYSIFWIMYIEFFIRKNDLQFGTMCLLFGIWFWYCVFDIWYAVIGFCA